MAESPSPIASLSHETLSEIFIYTLPSTALMPHTVFPWTKTNIPSASVSPLLLCRVSSLWRDIAIHDPRLWTSLSTQFVDHSELISIWLSRAGSMPLSLHLARAIRPPSVRFLTRNAPILWEEHDYLSPIHRHLPLLLPKISSCRHLEMEDVFIPSFLRPSSSPSLESLSVVVRSSNTEAADWFSSVMAQAPRLARLHWEGAPLAGSTVPWAQLTHLSLHFTNLTVSHVASALKAAIQVQNLRLHLRADPAQSFYSSSHPILMPSVTTFNFSGDMTLARILTLPNMTHLVIEWMGQVPDPQDLQHFLRRSGCMVTSLEVWETPGWSPSFPGLPNMLLTSPQISSSITRLLMPSEILNEFFLWLEQWSPGTLPQQLLLLRDVDRCFRIDNLPGLEDAATSGFLAFLIKSRLPNLEDIYLDDNLPIGELLESHHAGLGPTALFTVWRSARLLREYQAWWLSLDSSPFRAALETGDPSLIAEFDIHWDQISGHLPSQQNRFAPVDHHL
ncbi:hypothetical protein K438DRAFT_1782185 [Mycena galopus ATCC 62051]|nr:hypothetical protein K438DRAFT_1782185 [Mycena galopus ATCC 62051]